METILCEMLKKEVATHYVSKLGNEYPKDEYANHGQGGVYRGYKDLPLDEYPYTIKYQTIYPLWLNCK